MIVQSSNIAMISNHSLLIEEEKTESFRAWVDSSETEPSDLDSKLDAMEAAMKEGVSLLEGLREFAPKVDRNELLEEMGGSPDTLKLSEKAEKFLAEMKGMMARRSEVEKLLSEPVKPGDELYLLKMMIEHMLGKEVEVYDPSGKDDDDDHGNEHGHEHVHGHGHEIEGVEIPLSKHAKGPVPNASGQANAEQERVGWGIEYNNREVYHEVEQTSFASKGTIKTADGREIGFTLNLDMSREFLSVTEESMRAGDALLVDPLVINFSGRAVDLTDRKFLFDLDSDGDADSISFVTPGSGIIAFDLSGDGIINNGSELFGPSTGNGFMELGAFDEDGNGWIDAGDSVYSKLIVWSKDYSGNDVMTSLKDTGVGAIYLESAETLFSINDSTNAVKGQVASTGIYLSESGLNGEITPGTIQQVNLVV